MAGHFDKKPNLSIIIPTLNEFSTISKLLDSISWQTYKHYEVVIVDGKSADKTVKVVKSYSKKIPNLKIVVEARRGIGRARNVGAANSSGEYLLFLDADVILDKDFLKDCMQEFDGRFLDVASCYITPLSLRLSDYFLHEVANVAMKTLQYVTPVAPGFCIFATKRMHERIGGFDEKIKMAEDINYIERASRIGKFRVLKNSKVKVSVRRLDKEGRSKLVLKYIYIPIYRTFVGEVTKPIFKYEFGNFHKKNKNFNDVLLKLEKDFVNNSLQHFKKFKQVLGSLKRF